MNQTGADGAQSRRQVFKFTAILAVLLMALIALNAPITFAGNDSGSSSNVALAQADTSTDNAVADVAEQANPATVTVLNLQQQVTQFGQSSDEAVPVGSGSGYIIDADGHVVTNNHVVERAASLQAVFMDGTTVDATLVGTDPYQDVAVLKLELAAGQALPGTVSFADSSTVRTGDTVIAIGSPYGEYANTVTAGIINATDRSLDTGEGYLMPNLFQHDAEIYPGNSGGPLLNTDGEVIGMNVAKALDPTVGYNSTGSDTNIGFAIESNAIKSIVDEIISTGHVARPYLGIRTQATRQGQGVMSVEADGPAADAGIEAGDLITAIDGQEIDTDHPFINELIFGHKPGEDVTLTFERNGQSIDLMVTLGERPVETT
jgi:S1-C subfamily serine protease